MFGETSVIYPLSVTDLDISQEFLTETRLLSIFRLNLTKGREGDKQGRKGKDIGCEFHRLTL